MSAAETVIAEWPLNKRGEHLRVLLGRHNGYDLLNLRKWFEDEEDKLRPTKQGIAIQVKHLPKLVDAVTKALAVAVERGLIETDGQGIGGVSRETGGRKS